MDLLKDLNNKTDKSKISAFNIIIRIVICLSIIVVGVMGMKILASMKKPPAEVKPEEPSLKVETMRVGLEDVPVFITGYGEIKSLNVVSIAPEVSGRVVMVNSKLEAGEVIHSGEILFKIDPTNYSASLKEAEAMVKQWETSIKRLEKQFSIDSKRLKNLERSRDLAKAEFDRVKKLFKSDNIGTRSGVDKAELSYNSALDFADQLGQAVALYPIRIKEAQTNLVSAKARMTMAKANLDRCTVRTYFNGRVKSVTLENGQYVMPGQNVMTLSDDSILEIQVSLDSVDARKWLEFEDAEDNLWFSGLKKVQCGIKWTEDNSGKEWPGILHRVVRFDRHTRTLVVAVRIDYKALSGQKNKGLPLVEGMFCFVRIPGKTIHNVFRLPMQAVTFDKTVYTAVDNRLKTINVSVEKIEGEEVYARGLKSGDMVIVTRLIDPLENALLKITKERKKL